MEKYMGQNQALKKFHVEDFLFSRSEIEAMIETREHIFEIRNPNENTIGFISLYDLKTLFSSDSEEISSYHIKNIDQENWTQIIQHPFFQRRKPQLVPQNITNEIQDDVEPDLYLLIRGQKNGPYTKDEVKGLIDTKDILLTDLVSMNDGHTWTKIYQLDGIDRRQLTQNDVLPGLPDREVFDSYTAKSAKTNNAKGEVIEAMTGLAYLGNLKRGKAIVRDQENHLDRSKNTAQKSNNIYKIILAVSIIGIGYVSFNLKNSLKSPFNESSAIQDENSKDLTGTENNEPQNNKMNNNAVQTNNDLRRTGKFETRNLNPIKRNNQRSFTDSTKFKNMNQNADIQPISNDETYYYNENQPIELDPVRSKVSKETSEEGSGGTLGDPGPVPTSDPLFNQEVDN
jgi:hypothetical protein